MNGRSVAKPILVATLVCGTLDILWAALISLWRGRVPAYLYLTTDGPMLCTFTPLNGLTEIVLRFLPQLAGVAVREPGTG